VNNHLTLSLTAYKLRILASLGLVFLILLGYFWGADSSQATGGCPDYLFVGARGSGEEYKPDAANDHGVGTRVFSFYQHLADDLFGAGLEIQLDPVPKPPYDAVGINWHSGPGAFFHLDASYEKSVRVVEPWVREEVERQLALCPSMKLILSGYSQGAQGLADALQRDIPASDVVGAAFFGDPYFNPRSPGDYGSFDSERIGILGVRPQYGPSLAHKVFSYCHDKDPICQGFIRYSTFAHLTSWDSNQHGNYATLGDPSETDTEMAADNVAALIRADQASKGNPIEEPSAGPISGPLDVAFAIDSTGSMGGIIESVKSNVAQLAEQLHEADPDFRVALVDYKDAPPYSTDIYQAEVDQNFTTDLGAFDSAVAGLLASGGGDTPESVYTGMMTALELPWRNGAHKELVVIGDAGGHPVDPETGYTADDVVATSLALDPVAINAIPASAEAEETLGPVAERTGGADVPAEGDVAGAITQTIQAAQTSPVASLGMALYEGYADLPIVLNAGGSFSPLGRLLTYGWDFDDNGTIDETTTSAVVEHMFGGGYSGPVSVTVTDDHGQSAVAQAQVTAGGKAPAPPQTPGVPVLSTGDHSVTASWLPPIGGGPVDLYQLIDSEGAPAAIVAASTDSGIQTATIGELKNGEPISLAVTALNGVGSATSELSAPATPGPGTAAFVPTLPSSPPVPVVAGKPKEARKCRKGFRKKTFKHHKTKCVKVKKARGHKKHKGRSHR
jgi:hypothetical protein